MTLTGYFIDGNEIEVDIMPSDALSSLGGKVPKPTVIAIKVDERERNFLALGIVTPEHKMKKALGECKTDGLKPVLEKVFKDFDVRDAEARKAVGVVNDAYEKNPSAVSEFLIRGNLGPKAMSFDKWLYRLQREADDASAMKSNSAKEARSSPRRHALCTFIAFAASLARLFGAIALRAGLRAVQRGPWEREPRGQEEPGVPWRQGPRGAQGHRDGEGREPQASPGEVSWDG